MNKDEKRREAERGVQKSLIKLEIATSIILCLQLVVLTSSYTPSLSSYR